MLLERLGGEKALQALERVTKEDLDVRVREAAKEAIEGINQK